MNTPAALSLVLLGLFLFLRGWLTGKPRMAVLAVFLALPIGCAGAGPTPSDPATLVVDAVGIAIDERVPDLADEMRKEGLQQIAMSETREEAEWRVMRVKASWQGVWLALDVAKRLHDSAADLLERGTGLSLKHLSELARAYCDVRELLGEKGHEMPEPPIVGCPKEEP